MMPPSDSAWANRAGTGSAPTSPGRGSPASLEEFYDEVMEQDRAWQVWLTSNGLKIVPVERMGGSLRSQLVSCVVPKLPLGNPIAGKALALRDESSMYSHQVGPSRSLGLTLAFPSRSLGTREKVGGAGLRARRLWWHRFSTCAPAPVTYRCHQKFSEPHG